MYGQQQIEASEYELSYVPDEVEGECVLLAILPVRLNRCKYILYLIFSVVTLGILPLLTYWFTNLKRKICYNECSLEESTNVCIQNYDNSISIVQKEKATFFDGKTQRQHTFFTNRYLKYNIFENNVEVIKFKYQQKCISNHMKSVKGWSMDQAQKLRNVYGPGAMVIDIPTTWQIFVKQVFRPLYIFLIINWILQIEIQYYFFCFLIMISTLIGLGMTIVELRKINDRIFEMAYYEVELDVLRDGEVRKISSFEVVPGDLVFFGRNMRVPFEGVLLEGEMLINQCALTGQSVPVAKKSEPVQKYINQETISRNCFIFQGTTIVQINNKKAMNVWQKYRLDYGLPVCVTKTNFTTMKGQLIRKILFPYQIENKFQKQSTKFLYFLFVLSVISYIALCVKLYPYVKAIVLIKRGLDVISITVPPTLPISMLIGIVYAVDKLKNKEIYTISPNQIIEGGLLEVMCFDKTGTLTHDEMDFKTLVPCSGGHFSKAIKTSSQTAAQKEDILKIEHALANMAANHTVVYIEASKEVVGDPMELKLLHYSQSRIIVESSDPSIVFSFQGPCTSGAVLQRFDFESNLQRMSVIVQNKLGQIHVYTKGSPQVMLGIMDERSVPVSYKQVLKEYASSGFRILAIAHRKVEAWKKLERSELQSKLIFDGFQVFDNGLKPETKGAISELRENKIDPIMITGDNPITASNIGYQSGILDADTKTLIIDYSNEVGFSEEQFNFVLEGLEKKTYRRHKAKRRSIRCIDSGSSEIDIAIDGFLEKVAKSDFNICLTGAAFNHIFSQEEEQGKALSPMKADLLRLTQILARTKPSDKARVVKLYQNLGKVVGMCGDGANDCAALHQANLGLSLSDTQASIAAAFTSKNRHIGSMVELIKESRAGLATNFSLFNVMAAYALTQFSTSIIEQYFYSYPSDIQFVYWDLFLNMAFVLLLGNIPTVKSLTVERPSSSLFSIGNITELLSYYLLQLSGQILTILAVNGPFSDNIDYFSVGGDAFNLKHFFDEGGDDFIFDSPENNCLFVVSNFYYLASVLAFTVTKPWKEPVYTFWPFVLCFVLNVVYSACIAVVPQLRLGEFDLRHLVDSEFNYFLFAVGAGVSVLFLFLHTFILRHFTAWLNRPEDQQSE